MSPADGLPVDNPFAAPSDLPFGLPPFGEIRGEHFAPAFDAGMAAHRAELDELLAAEPTAAAFLDGLEAGGRLLARAEAVFWNLTGTDADDALRAVQEEYAPRLAAHHDAVRLDPRVVARVRALHEDPPADLDDEARRLLERLHSDAVRSGALLDAAGAERLRELNAELSALTTRFDVELLADTNDLAVRFTDAAELEGLAPADLARAGQAARARGLDGYLLPLALPTGQPVLEQLRRRDSRERVHRASVSRGGRGGEHDTRILLQRIAALRAERAQLLGFADHASWVVADETAGDAEAAAGLLRRLAPAAAANARAEEAELTEVLVAAGEEAPLRAWDWAWCAGLLRQQRFSLDAEQLRPWFELERVLVDGVFATASALYGLSFTERDDLPVYSTGVRVFEVAGPDGPFGLYLFDPYARPSKRGGAWMSSFAEQSRLLGTAPVVVNCLNVPEPAAGEPALLTVDEVETLFHEFGHTLHGLLSDVRYPRFSGTNVPRDFVEFPSQVNEFWGFEPEVLQRYARHHVTGEPLPAGAAEALRAARSFGQGFSTLEYLAAALLDAAWHRVAPGDLDGAGPDDVQRFEAAALAEAGVALETVPPRYRSSYFHHVFGGGYAAAYYSYVWSEVLDADAVEWFRENGGLRRENGEHFRRTLLSRGGAVDPVRAYRDFRGRDAQMEPLLRRRGLTAA
ncbi:M3 family metallopeptidase [Paenibacillus sp. TRM 82003]|uniref:M3 family metallopeptidase n=1 Tax=Kineococcus sp. TRM81007 TaxID=2925831 RepID=UPI001F560F49|nr:M3 family metallopeptidase [Kineococcus sp. TRM81007]MCI2239924.1 M3 family metallopeptidase [Kineococcus sp. TRM81007]MCI3925771.1 M3 family metallopeptidase [Paenibacillus sp. TRM 82003]